MERAVDRGANLAPRTRGAATGPWSWTPTSATRLAIALVVVAAGSLPLVGALPHDAAAAGAGSRSALVVALVLGALLAVLAARPRPGEPGVHDRQVDGILAVPPLAAAAWLALGWPRPDAGGPPDPAAAGRALAATLALLAGTALLLGGTRLVARSRWALLVLATAMPGIPAGLAVTVAVATTAAVVLRTARAARAARVARVAPARGAVDGSAADTRMAAAVVSRPRAHRPALRGALFLLPVVPLALLVHDLATGVLR